MHLVTARHSKDPRKQVFGVLKVGSTINDMAHHFGCFMILLTGTTVLRLSESLQDNISSLSCSTLTHPCNRFNQQPLLLGLYGVHVQKISDHFIQNNAPGIFYHDTARFHTTRK